MLFYGNGSAFCWFGVSHALPYAENLPESLIVAAYASGILRPYARNDLIGFAVNGNIAVRLAVIA
jgi:hypothetical protein